MTTDAEYKVDRTHWPPGPWNDEPDKLQFRTAVGLPGLIVRNQLGGLCGYVGVPREHPDHGAHYGEIDVSVHGGLTYSRACRGHICHVPEPGEPDDVWWLGFFEVYRDLAYVTAQVESLASQLAERAGPKGSEDK